MTPKEIIVELAEGAANLNPLLERLKKTVTRIDDPDLTRQIIELINLNGKTWLAVAELMHYAQTRIKSQEVTR